MNVQVIMMLIAGVSVIRFFKGMTTRKRGLDINTEVDEFIAHLIVVFGVYGIVYLILSIF